MIGNGHGAFSNTNEEGDCLINKSKLFHKIDPVYLANLSILSSVHAWNIDIPFECLPGIIVLD